MGQLFILRHGNTFERGDIIRRVGCRTDLPLSPSGHAQAAALAEAFRLQGQRFDAVFCSELQRTRQTAQHIIEALSPGAVPEVLPFLNEIDYGPDEGQPEETVVARLGTESLERWETCGELPPGWMLEPGRVTQGWADLMARAAADDDVRLLAVTSNGIGRYALPLCHAFEAEKPAQLKLGTCCYATIRCTPGRYSLTGWNVKRPEELPAQIPVP